MEEINITKSFSIVVAMDEARGIGKAGLVRNRFHLGVGNFLDVEVAMA